MEKKSIFYPYVVAAKVFDRNCGRVQQRFVCSSSRNQALSLSAPLLHGWIQTQPCLYRYSPDTSSLYRRPASSPRSRLRTGASEAPVSQSDVRTCARVRKPEKLPEKPRRHKGDSPGNRTCNLLAVRPQRSLVHHCAAFSLGQKLAKERK